MKVSRKKAALAVAVGALTLLAAGPARAACEGQPGAPVVLRPVRDTRIMQAHPSANDGAAGLVWLKRSSHVRGLVGFDVSCQAAATPDLGCASLEVSIYEGNPGLDGSNFSAHRMLVPWIEGNQSFNEFNFGTAQLGPFGGTGAGTNWDCRVDPALSNNTGECTGADRWDGADDCGNGVPCYDPVPATAYYANPSQTTLSWDVTASTTGASGDTSWLLKVEDETKKSGAVKFYTRNGAQFMAEHDPLPGGESRFDAAPRLLLWGPGLQAPTATLVSPLGLLLDDEPLVRIRQQGATIGGPARWANLTTGAWGWMAPDDATDWTATIPLVPGENRVEFTVFDACGTEGRLERTLLYGSGGAGCGDSGCSRAFLCYGARVTRSAPDFDPVYGRASSDDIDAEPVDVLEPAGLCVPADIEGEGIADPTVFGVAYEARPASDAAPHEQVVGIQLTDRFGSLVVDTLRVDGLIAPASLGLGFDPAPLPDAPGPYKCYRVATVETDLEKGTTVRAIDEFENREYRIRRPQRICYPTAQPAVGDPVGPLSCYRVKRASGEPRHHRVRDLLHTTDAFGSLELDTRGEDELCVEASAD